MRHSIKCCPFPSLQLNVAATWPRLLASYRICSFVVLVALEALPWRLKALDDMRMLFGGALRARQSFKNGQSRKIGILRKILTLSKAGILSKAVTVSPAQKAMKSLMSQGEEMLCNVRVRLTAQCLQLKAEDWMRANQSFRADKVSNQSMLEREDLYS